MKPLTVLCDYLVKCSHFIVSTEEVEYCYMAQLKRQDEEIESGKGCDPTLIVSLPGITGCI